MDGKSGSNRGTHGIWRYMDDVYFVPTIVYLCITQGSKLGCCGQMEADVAFIIIIIISSIPPQSVGCKLEGWHCCRGSGASDRLSDGSDDLFRLVYDLHQHQHQHLASAKTSLAVSTSSSSSSWWQWWSTRRPSTPSPLAVFGKQVSAVYRNKKHDTGPLLAVSPTWTELTPVLNCFLCHQLTVPSQ